MTSRAGARLAEEAGMNTSPILVGRAPAFPLAAVLQAVEANQLSGLLRLGFEGTDQSHGAKLGFDKGKLVLVLDRQSDGDTGAQTIIERAIVVLQRADDVPVAYAFHEGTVEPQSAPINVTGVLLETARRQDEAR